MIFLAIDYGIKRTGTALSTGEENFAYPCRTICMQGKEVFFSELFALAEAHDAQAYVVGLPLALDGTDTETTRQVRNMVSRLKRRTALPVYVVSEVLSSYAAESHLREAGVKQKKSKAVVDQAAAVAILTSFLSLPHDERRRA